MKKNIYWLLLMMSFLSFSQEAKKQRKIQIGFQYNTELETDYIYQGIAGVNIRYNVVPTKNINLNIGLNSYLINSKIKNFSNLVIINPNIVAEINISEIPLKPYLGIGYNFYNSTFTPSQLIGFPKTAEAKSVYNGININPGVRYYIKDFIFFDLNYNYINTHSSGQLDLIYHLLGIGAGLKF
jgi:hypothetical protein